jgi:hypothetical protein
MIDTIIHPSLPFNDSNKAALMGTDLYQLATALHFKYGLYVGAITGTPMGRRTGFLDRSLMATNPAHVTSVWLCNADRMPIIQIGYADSKRRKQGSRERDKATHVRKKHLAYFHGSSDIDVWSTKTSTVVRKLTRKINEKSNATNDEKDLSSQTNIATTIHKFYENTVLEMVKDSISAYVNEARQMLSKFDWNLSKEATTYALQLVMGDITKHELPKEIMNRFEEVYKQLLGRRDASSTLDGNRRLMFDQEKWFVTMTELGPLVGAIDMSNLHDKIQDGIKGNFNLVDYKDVNITVPFKVYTSLKDIEEPWRDDFITSLTMHKVFTQTYHSNKANNFYQEVYGNETLMYASRTTTVYDDADAMDVCGSFNEASFSVFNR